jgi:7,8-dihydropterin-6-yl-methyl-4-(beta-D-ribofuranosyl)aminobenzene 5'-phosphate synthase
MNLICLVDDAVQRSSPFWGEHGLAFLIEVEDEGRGRRLLFDTGQSGTVLLHNLDLFDINVETVEAVAISHAHYDHTGGLPALLERLEPRTPLYANLDLFRERFADRGQWLETIGLRLGREALAQRLALRLAAGPQEILPGVWTTGEIAPRTEVEGRSASHLMRQGAELVADAYRDDMALVLDTGDRLALVCGCCHAGLLNTLAHVERTFDKPIAVIAGGLHLTSVGNQDLQKIARVLAAMPALERVYPNHCTGEAAYVALTQILGSEVVHPCPAGSRLRLPVET